MSMQTYALCRWYKPGVMSSYTWCRRSFLTTASVKSINVDTRRVLYANCSANTTTHGMPSGRIGWFPDPLVPVDHTVVLLPTIYGQPRTQTSWSFWISITASASIAPGFHNVSVAFDIQANFTSQYVSTLLHAWRVPCAWYNVFMQTDLQFCIVRYVQGKFPCTYR